MAVSADLENNKKKPLTCWQIGLRLRFQSPELKGRSGGDCFVRRSSLSRLYIGHFISILLCGVVVWDDRGLSALLSAI